MRRKNINTRHASQINTRGIASVIDMLYNHSVNVCIILGNVQGGHRELK